MKRHGQVISALKIIYANNFKRYKYRMTNVYDAKKTVGRPTVDSEAVNVRCERNLLERLDDWIKIYAPGMSRPRAIKHCVRTFLGILNDIQEVSGKMTPAERELLILLGHMITIQISNDLRVHGLAPDEGRGGSFIRKINELSAKIKIEADE